MGNLFAVEFCCTGEISQLSIFQVDVLTFTAQRCLASQWSVASLVCSQVFGGRSAQKDNCAVRFLLVWIVGVAVFLVEVGRKPF